LRRSVSSLELGGAIRRSARRGTAERTYQFTLNDRFRQETTRSTYLPQEKNKNGEVHPHMSMIRYDTARKLFVLRQFHSEGFVNTYVQQLNEIAVSGRAALGGLTQFDVDNITHAPVTGWQSLRSQIGYA
jgi:hypothetical protein